MNIYTILTFADDKFVEFQFCIYPQFIMICRINKDWNWSKMYNLQFFAISIHSGLYSSFYRRWENLKNIGKHHLSLLMDGMWTSQLNG